MTRASPLVGGASVGNAVQVPPPAAEAVLSRSYPDVASGRDGPSVGDDDRAWARWNTSVGRRYTVGVEEEVMLLDPSNHRLAQCSDFLLSQLSEDLGGHTSAETHASVVELVSGIHLDVAAAVRELETLRERFALELRPLSIAVACAGMHPFASPQETRISRAERYRLVADSMRSLARRSPTMALHVHVGVPGSEEAVRVLNRLRENVPLLLALAANSPFTEGRDSGFASARTVIFDGFPRTGTPRPFASYADYVESIDPLIASRALPDASFLWWDVRLQPALGTVEVRVMDSQTSAAQSAPLIALVQSLARLELEGEPRSGPVEPEVLAENRFLAARDGLDALLIDPARNELVPVRTQVEAVLEACLVHASALGCAAELEQIASLAAINGARRQRIWARNAGGVRSVVSRLAEEFIPPSMHAFHATNQTGRSD